MVPNGPLSIVCLCAAWCRTCESYRAIFESVTTADNQLAAHWLDIEDDADQLGDLDIETFPTLLIAHESTPLFFGPVLPHASALEHLVARLRNDAVPLAIGSAAEQADLKALLASLERLPTAS